MEMLLSAQHGGSQDISRALPCRALCNNGVHAYCTVHELMYPEETAYAT